MIQKNTRAMKFGFIKYCLILLLSISFTTLKSQDLFEMLNNSDLKYAEKVERAEAYFDKYGKDEKFKKFYKFYRRWQVRAEENVNPNGYVMTTKEADGIMNSYNKRVSNSKALKAQSKTAQSAKIWPGDKAGY